MSKKYTNATIIEQANVYFDGKVNSRTLHTSEGKTVTLGFMQAGEYLFNTAAAEVMTVINGAMNIKLKDTTEWKTVQPGESFNVPANSHFEVTVETFADYSCVYLED